MESIGEGFAEFAWLLLMEWSVILCVDRREDEHCLFEPSRVFRRPWCILSFRGFYDFLDGESMICGIIGGAIPFFFFWVLLLLLLLRILVSSNTTHGPLTF